MSERITRITPTHRSSGVLQRKTCACGKPINDESGECDDCRKKHEAAQSSILQRSATNGSGIDTAPPSVYETLRSTGQPLDSHTRDVMESRFEHDFSGVRVHADGQAARSARDVAAHAYTVGNTVVFGAGEYRPQSADGQRLIAHELTHVVQQAGQKGAQSKSLKVYTGGEIEAEQTAKKVISGNYRIGRISAAGVGLARQPMVIPRQSFEERLQRIDALMSYSMVDWAITDAEAIEAFELLSAMTPSEQAAALPRFRVDRLVDNLPLEYQARLRKIIVEAGGEQIILKTVTELLRYWFLDWLGTVNEEQAQRSLQMLEALEEEQRDRVLDRIPPEKRRRLHDALTSKDQTRFLKLWEGKNERKIQRQQLETHRIVPGDAYLIQVQISEIAQKLQVFSSSGTSLVVDPDGYAYFAPLNTWIYVLGKQRAEAEVIIAGELTRIAGYQLSVELKPRPPTWQPDFFEPPPPPHIRATPRTVVEQAPKAAETDPYIEKSREFRSIYKSYASELNALGERWRASSNDKKLWTQWESDRDALENFYKWYTAHENSPELLKTDLVALMSKFHSEATGRRIKAEVTREYEEKQEAEQYSPEMAKKRIAKMDEFMNLALQLKGESTRRFPYRIPVESEGVDILVTGDPARQAVLDLIADELMKWERNHMLDNNFMQINPRDILLHILNSGYGALLGEANKSPLEAEAIDRHELIFERTIKTFGKTIAIGLGLIAIVGAAVGLGLISGGAAFILLGSMLAIGGIAAYRERRQEIEQKGYDVPVPVTAVQAAGDAVGVSQLIEGISGTRLGIDERLKSTERSDRMGEGAGGIALLLVGSRAFGLGQSVGQGVRLRAPGLVPETLEGVPLRDLGKHYPPVGAPRMPVKNPKPGPVEAAARDALPERLRVGFDQWMEDIRSRDPNMDVEAMLKKMPQEKIAKISQKPAEGYYARLESYEAAFNAKTRSSGDPLRPRLKFNEWRDGVSISYEKTPPSETEINHARAIQKRTGEPVRVFGDTPAKQTYPGIDGTIGDSPRALQLKSLHDPAYVKVHAADALESAAKHGYSKVEVHIRAPNNTIAELKAAWNAKPAHLRGADFQWETRLSMARAKLLLSRIVVEGSDGVWTIEAPPTSPNAPGILVPGTKEKEEAK